MSGKNRQPHTDQADPGSPGDRHQRQPPDGDHEEPAEGRGQGGEGERPMARPLFPLSELLQQVLRQEEQLWRRNEGLLQSLRASPAVGAVELEGAGADRVSVKSLSPDYTSEEGLYLIRYGQLTNVIHRYFRKLEKNHACLYLTGRKAKHESLRHVDINTAPGAEDYAPEAQSVGVLLMDERQLVILRDEELLVYRCALMCAQFPMLSAPTPPEGHSPTPTLPLLPLSFHPTELGSLSSTDLSRTAPSEYHGTTALPQHLKESREHAATLPPPSQRSTKSLGAGELGPPTKEEGAGEKLRETKSLTVVVTGDQADGDRPKIDSAVKDGTTAPEPSKPAEPPSPEAEHSSTVGPLPHAPELQSLWPGGTRPPPSDPIPIQSRGGSGSKSSGRSKASRGRREGGGTETLAQKRPSRRVPSEVHPAMDSGAESEVAELTAGKSLHGADAPKAPAREQPFTPMVNREMLSTLVRCAFHQSEEQQLQHEQILRHEYGRRSKGEILAKELAGQLQVLENNAHPFYKPKLFVTRNGYDQWLQAEKQRIRGLIDKFWHYSLPRPQLWRHFNPTDYHRAYAILQQKIVDCESRTERREPVHSGRTPSAPLSPTAIRLLTEFGLRYGVGELYRRIVYLDYLAKHFDYEIWYIRHCTEELQRIRGLLPRNRNKVTAVRREMELLRSTVHLLHGQTDNSLTRIDRLFHDSDPKEGVACLIELLSEVLDAEQSLFGKKVRPVDDWLTRYLKSGFVLRYERRKEIASDETLQSRTAQPFILTPTLVNALLLSIRDEVHDYREKFQTVFRPYFDIVPFAKAEFYRLLCTDACTLCARIIHRPETRQTLSLEMLGLMYRLNERDREWESVITPDMQLWRRQFVDLALVWMDVLRKQITQWTLQAVGSDQWTLLTFSASLGRDPFSPQGTPLPSRHAFGIKNAVRPSPFPSPMITPNDHTSFVPGSLGRNGAFVPYERSRRREKELSSESSGAVTDISSSGTSVDSSSLPITESADVMMGINGFHEEETSVGGNDSLLRFGQGPRRRGRDQRWSRGVDFSESAGGHAQEIEITASVYEVDEPIASPANHHGDRSSADGAYLQEYGSVESQPSTAVNGVTQSQSSPLGGRSSPPLTSSRTHDAGSLKMNGDESNPDRPNGVPHSSASLPSVEAGSWLPQEDFQSVVRFGNMLDNCASGESAVEDDVVVKPKPVPAGAVGGGHDLYTGGSSSWTTAEDASLSARTPPVATDAGLSGRSKDRPSSPKLASKGSSVSSSSSPSPSVKACSSSSVDGGRSPLLSPDTGDTQVKPFLFPVSNSPVDMVTMLTRLAAFTGVVLQVLTPKLRRNVGLPDDPGANQEYSSEVATARAQASQQWRLAEDMKTELLKKLHKAFVNSLKLYADNLLCMDLCCWSGTEATKLLGDQMVYHLKRRKDTGEIWGCRHIVEARHGLHPHGTPCEKNSKIKFESITRDMCVRINNIQALITIFSSLESHLYACTRTAETHKPATALGYISSEGARDLSPPTVSHGASKSVKRMTARPNPHRARLPDDTAFPAFSPATMSWRSSLSAGLGPMEPDDAGGGWTRGQDKAEESRPEVGFRSRESVQVLEYLKTMQKHQLRLLCLRMNKFFKPALSLLLDLRLAACRIEKRLNPLVTFLDRHRTALRKYVYPECFDTIMKYLWECIVQDLEEEAAQLRSKRRPVTDKAQLLLQALAHLIEFLHDRGNGLSLDLLTSSSEYLLGLLDIMTRSSDQLIKIFSTLSTPQFTRSRMDVSYAPVSIDPVVLHSLRHQLHTFKKCFTGKDFVDAIITIGSHHNSSKEGDTEPNTPSPAPPSLTPSPHSFSPVQAPRLRGNQTITPAGQFIVYTVHYASEVAQYLLNERVLLPVTVDLTGPTTPTQSSSCSSVVSERHQEPGSAANGPQQLVDSSERPSAANTSRHLHSQVLANGSGFVSSESPQTSRSRSRPKARSRSDVQRTEAYIFKYSSQNFYKFADIEDLEADKLFQSQILSSVSHVERRARERARGGVERSGGRRLKSNGGEDFLEFHRARSGTVFLVLDLLAQRARKEKKVKQFYQSPRTLAVIEQRRRNDVSCDQIFKV